MLRTFTCIVCPNGCEVTAEIENGEVVKVTGNTCPRGEDYVRQEIIDPRRTIASSVPVIGGELPLTSVRITKPIPKKDIFEAMRLIKSFTVEAPVEAGTVLAEGLFGTEAKLIVTKSVKKK